MKAATKGSKRTDSKIQPIRKAMGDPIPSTGSIPPFFSINQIRRICWNPYTPTGGSSTAAPMYNPARRRSSSRTAIIQNSAA